LQSTELYQIFVSLSLDDVSGEQAVTDQNNDFKDVMRISFNFKM